MGEVMRVTPEAGERCVPERPVEAEQRAKPRPCLRQMERRDEGALRALRDERAVEAGG
jgi:hypothetical protein